MFDQQRFKLWLDFVQERHNVWCRRQLGQAGPWTSDPILASRKFTNVFRVLDPGSQFIFDLAEGVDARTFLMRCFLYRHTGRVEAWRSLLYETGEYPTPDNLQDTLEAWRLYREAGSPIFTGAYLVYPGSSIPGTDKLESMVTLTDRLFNGGGVAQQFLAAKSQQERFATLRRNKGVADFMSMQILTDYGYCDDADREDEFVVPGPGCRKGVAHITDTRDVAGFLRLARWELMQLDDCPSLDINGTTRYPSIMDVQNTMCEFSKYVRYLESGKVGAPYVPAHPGQQPQPKLPSHWA